MVENSERKPTLVITSQPSRAPDSNKTDASIPNLTLMLPGRAGCTPSWADVVATFEFKESDAFVQDVSKTIFVIHLDLKHWKDRLEHASHYA